MQEVVQDAVPAWPRCVLNHHPHPTILSHHPHPTIMSHHPHPIPAERVWLCQGSVERSGSSTMAVRVSRQT